MNIHPSLTILAENRIEIRLLNGIKHIVQNVMVPDLETRRSAVGALINISVNARNKIEIRNDGGIPPLIQCLGATDAETRRFALRVVYNLVLNGNLLVEFHVFILDQRKTRLNSVNKEVSLI